MAVMSTAAGCFDPGSIGFARWTLPLLSSFDLRPFSFEVIETDPPPASDGQGVASVAWGENRSIMRFMDSELIVRLNDEAQLKPFLTKYPQASIKKRYQFLAMIAPSGDEPNRQELAKYTIDYLMHWQHDETEPLDALTLLGRSQGMRGHYVFGSKRGALLYQAWLKILLDPMTDIDGAYINGISSLL
jgi:hypothetical protein